MTVTEVNFYHMSRRENLGFGVCFDLGEPVKRCGMITDFVFWFLSKTAPFWRAALHFNPIETASFWDDLAKTPKTNDGCVFAKGTILNGVKSNF